MSNLQHRVKELEKQQPARVRAPKIADGERLARMKELAVAIAQEAARQRVTAKDNPALALPLAMAEAWEAK